MAELADAPDLKSGGPQGSCGFDSRPRHSFHDTCFDGVSYLSEIPVPTILNSLLPADEIWPTVEVLVDNGDASESAGDLDNHAAFADFLAKELLPWVRRNWRV